MPPGDPAPIRGPWTITPEMRARFDWAWNEWYYGPRREGRSRIWFAIEAMLEAVPVPDEAAIERGAKGLHQRDVDDPACEPDRREWDQLTVALQDEYRADALTVLRAALEAPEKPS